MTNLLLRITFEDLLDLIRQLPPDQKRIVRQQIDADWSTRFGAALDAIQADIPPGISDDETQDDIDRAIGEVRARS
jgi:hypothetical protein